MRPHPLLMGAIILTVIVGALVALSFFSQEEGTGEFHQRGILTVIITSIITFCLLIIATSKLWFTHLWKKNSTHERHKQHSRYHPAVQEREFRKRR